MNISTDIASLLAKLPPMGESSVSSSAAEASPTSPTDATKSTGFEGAVSKFIGEVNSQQLQADAAIENLATGRADNVHDVVLTAVKADLSVRMLLEIRNQLVSSYQEVMRMQL